MNPTAISRIADWRRAQGQSFADQMDAEVTLGPIYSDSWLRDPKHLVFALARYKFVAKMLANEIDVAEVGAGDAWASKIVARQVDMLDHYDLSPLTGDVIYHNVMRSELPRTYSAIYALDVFEHVEDGDIFFRHLALSLSAHGKLIVGTPSLEGQAYASEPSRKLHINCVSGEQLRSLAKRHFRHVFIAGMNDEVVHFGFLPMSHYLWAICCEPIR